ncbi:MAG: glutathione S-transferase family protein [Nannocystaceae bacterium]|nr:glutathione S-transferase family protein [Nannocystaceae bacterium]
MGASFRLYGTVTSPYVRRVRVVALELGLDCDLIDVATEHGQAQLRAVNPLWKVPAAEIGGEVIFDSRVIVDRLITGHGSDDTIAMPEQGDTKVRNVLTAIDGVLDALINVFYLSKDGIDPQTSSYLRKHNDRARATMAWLDTTIDDGWFAANRRFGLAELALVTTVGWMRFRDRYPVEDHAALMRCFERHDDRPSMLATRPPVS